MITNTVHIMFSRYVAVYIDILVRVLVRDVSRFVLVFLVFMVSFGGGLYFALRGEPCTVPQEDVAGMMFNPLTNTSLCLHPDETRFVIYK